MTLALVPEEPPDDADPRLYQPPKESPQAQAADLDEAERARFMIVWRRMERLCRKSPSFEESLLPAIWSIAHHRAIDDVKAARALKVSAREWDEGTWRVPANECAARQQKA